MQLQLTVQSESVAVLQLVREFAEGLGWRLASHAPSAIQLVEQDNIRGTDTLLHLLTHVALGAVKAGIDTSEPLCTIRYREGPASEVTLAVRVSGLSVAGPAAGA